MRFSKSDVWMVIGLVLLTGLAYFPTFSNGFVYFDDATYIFSNKQVAQGLAPASIAYAWTTFELGNWIPLTWLTYLLDAQLFGIQAWAFHATDLLLHCANAGLLFYFLRRTTGRTDLSAITAALFAVHPLHVESVAWAAERKDVLSQFWVLLALIGYQRYARQTTRERYGLVCLALVLGLLSKPMLVTAPLLFLLADDWPLQRWSGRPASDGELAPRSTLQLLIEKAPVFAICFFFGLMTLVAQAHAQAVVSLRKMPVASRAANAVQAYAWYLGKTFWPTRLCAYYVHPLETIDVPRTLIAAGVLLGVSVYVALGMRRRPWLLFGWLWFLISLAPVIGILQVGLQAYADRYTYLPHLGLLVMLVWEIDYWLPRSVGVRTVSAAVVSASLLASAAATWVQTGYWRDSFALWNRALAVNPRNWFAEYQLGCRSYRTGEFDAAVRHFERALEILPDYSLAMVDLAILRQGEMRWEEAAALLDQSLKMSPNDGRALYNRAVVARILGQAELAQRLLRRMKELHPEDAQTRDELGHLNAAQGRYELALQEFDAAIQRDPAQADYYNHAAMILAKTGRTREAIARLEQGLQQAPQDANLHDNLAALLEGEGKLLAALEHYRAALKIDPSDEEAQARIAALEEQLKSAPPK